MKATARKNSDHRGIVLSKSSINWEPKPFRVFNFRLKEESLLKLIDNKINETSLRGMCRLL